ncbi:MAG: PAS domain-containing protein [Balneolaceae bacterium]
MKHSQEKIKQKFFQQLEYFFSDRSEKNLVEAYELGRGAIEQGMGELEFLRLYHEALLQLYFWENGEEQKKQLKLALNFLSECLAPYELRQRGFKDLIRRLNEQNEKLQEEVERRRETEEELKQSKEHFQLLIENALDIITVLDHNGTIRYESPSLERILGYKPDEMTETVLFDYIHPDDLKKIKKELKSFTRLPGAKNITVFRVAHKDGSWRYLESIAKKVPDIRGGPGIIVNSRDVTDRFKAHQKLKESENQLAAAQKIAQLGSWEWNTVENNLKWSDELCNIYGVSQDKTPNTYEQWLQFVHSADRKRVEKILSEAFKTKKSYEFEHRIIRPDGTERTLYCMGEVTMAENQEVVKMFGTGQDITRIKKVEDKLRAYSEQLRNLSAKQDKIREEERIRIAREIHDELGQMLTVLKMDVSMLMKKTSDSTDEKKALKLSKEMEIITERINTIVQSVQRITTELRPEVLDDLGLEEAIEWQASEFEKRTGIKLYIISRVNSIDQMNDEQSTAVFRIFQETLTNILRHSGATQVTVRMKQDSEFFILNVHDNGKGITREEIEHKNSLGIISMRERSQFLGGSIDFEGEDGTKVTLKIPFAK